MSIERQELHCHNCHNYVQFDMDMELNGNHVLNCPNCGHEHCRVVKNGKITADRWDSRNGYAIQLTNLAWTVTSTWATYNGTANCSFLCSSWANTTAAY